MKPSEKGFLNKLKQAISLRPKSDIEIPYIEYFKQFIYLLLIISFSFGLVGFFMQSLSDMIYIFIAITVALITLFALLRLKWEHAVMKIKHVTYHANDVVLFDLLILLAGWISSQAIFFWFYYQEIVGTLFIILLFILSIILIIIVNVLSVILPIHDMQSKVNNHIIFMIVFILIFNIGLLYILHIESITLSYFLLSTITIGLYFTKSILVKPIKYAYLDYREFSWIFGVIAALTIILSWSYNGLSSDNIHKPIMNIPNSVQFDHQNLPEGLIHALYIDDKYVLDQVIYNNNFDVFFTSDQFFNYYQNINDQIYAFDFVKYDSITGLTTFNAYLLDDSGVLSDPTEIIIDSTSLDNSQLFIYQNNWYQIYNGSFYPPFFDEPLLSPLESNLQESDALDINDFSNEILAKTNDYVVVSLNGKFSYLNNTLLYVDTDFYYVYNNGYIMVIDSETNSSQIITIEDFIDDTGENVITIDINDIDLDQGFYFYAINNHFYITTGLDYDIDIDNYWCDTFHVFDNEGNLIETTSLQFGTIYHFFNDTFYVIYNDETFFVDPSQITEFAVYGHPYLINETALLLFMFSLFFIKYSPFWFERGEWV